MQIASEKGCTRQRGIEGSYMDCIRESSPMKRALQTAMPKTVGIYKTNVLQTALSTALKETCTRRVHCRRPYVMRIVQKASIPPA
eukprot:1161833-Pelagomonas_calceolata.AAC.20